VSGVSEDKGSSSPCRASMPCASTCSSGPPPYSSHKKGASHAAATAGWKPGLVASPLASLAAAPRACRAASPAPRPCPSISSAPTRPAARAAELTRRHWVRSAGGEGAGRFLRRLAGCWRLKVGGEGLPEDSWLGGMRSRGAAVGAR